MTSSYSVLVIFGRSDVDSTDLFRRVLDAITAKVDPFDIPLRVDGYIASKHRKNVAPRKAVLSDRAKERWQGSLSKGSFQYLNIYDSGFTDDTMPLLYAGIARLRDYVEGEYTDDTRVGAKSCLTVALESSLVSSSETVLESWSAEFAELLDVVYGFIEPEVAWVQQIGGRGGDRFINLRWRDVPEVDYKRGKFSMRKAVPRLYWGNILGPAHFKEDLPSNVVTKVENWSRGSIYVRFAADPQADPAFHETVAQCVHLVS